MIQRTSKDALEFFFSWRCTPCHGSTLRVVCILNETLFEEANFSFATGYQLEIASRLEIEVYVYFSQL